jgi:predicted transcriptional regulator
MKKKILHVRAGEPATASLARARATMQSLQAGKRSEPYFGIGFESMAQMLATFTPRRLDLLATLREQGPTTIAALARALKRDYKNVHGDINALVEWLAVDRDDEGQVFVPWDEIDIRLPLTKQAA